MLPGETMKKAAAALLILGALTIMFYYGFERPVLTSSILGFFAMMRDFSSGTLDFPYFVQSLGDVLFSLSMVFINLGVIWVGLELLASREEEFKFTVPRTTVVFLAVGGGFFFGGAFAHAFARALQFSIWEVLVQLVLAIASLEFTLTLLRYMQTDARRFRFSLHFR